MLVVSFFRSQFVNLLKCITIFLYFAPHFSVPTSESDESFDASGFTYNIPDPEDDMCSDTSTSGTDDHQEVFEELADKYRFQVSCVNRQLQRDSGLSDRE